jgi:acylaminoacyl-peptidase
MRENSSIAYASHVKTPTLVALGMSDLRIPPSQGLEWYHALQSRGIPTKLLTYEKDNHAIALVQSEADQWFDEYL